MCRSGGPGWLRLRRLAERCPHSDVRSDNSAVGRDGYRDHAREYPHRHREGNRDADVTAVPERHTDEQRDS